MSKDAIELLVELIKTSDEKSAEIYLKILGGVA